MESEKALLSDIEGHSVHEPSQIPAKHTSRLPWVICGILLLGNIITAVRVNRLSTYQAEVSKFAGLKYEYPTVYTGESDFTSANSTLAFETWTKIDTNPLQVALDDEYAREHGLMVSKFRWPWDETKGVYFLRAFHDLHCLKSVRKSFDDAIHGRPVRVNPAHTFHCLDSLRQNILCHADDTPMPLVAGLGEIGFGQVHQCRSIDDLARWSREGVRSACYHRFSDYNEITNRIEMFAFCPEDSPAFEKSRAYFEKFGHEPLKWSDVNYTADGEY